MQLPIKITWRRIIKFLLLGAIVLFTGFTITVWIVFEKKNDWLLQEIQSYLDKSQSGQLKIESLNLKLFRHLPRVTLQLSGITYYEHHDSLRASDEKPILQAEKLFVAIDLVALLNDELNITDISVTDAELNIIEYQHGVLNIDRALAAPVKPKLPTAHKPAAKPSTPVQAPKKTTKPKPKAPLSPPKQSVQIDLENVEFFNVTLNWRAYNFKKQSSITIEELETEFEKEEDIVMVSLNSSNTINTLYVNKLFIPGGKLSIQTELQLDRRNKVLTIHEGEISYNDYALTLNGTYEHLKNRKLDVAFDASSNDLQLLSSILRPGSVKNKSDLRGDIYAKGKIFGELKHQPLLFNISFGVSDLNLTLPENLGRFQDIGFEGVFTSGIASDYSEGTFELKNIHGHLPGGKINGKVRISNFVDPYLSYQLNTQLKLDGLDQIFKIDFLNSLKGSISLKADFDGLLKSFGTHEMDSSRSSSIGFQNISCIVSKTKQAIRGLSGKIETKNNQSVIQQLALQYGNNDLQINATVSNLVYLLFNLEREITVAGKLQSKQLFTKDFIPDTLITAQIQDRISNLSTDFEIKSVVHKQNDTLTKPEIIFQFKNLCAKLDKLPDLKSVNTQGRLTQTEKGFNLKLESFRAVLPQGTADVTGDLYIPSRRIWQFDAHVTLNKFPWTYVRELTAEIKDGQEPNAKNLPVKDMDLVTAELDVSSSMITYPYDISQLEIKNCKLNYQLPNSKLISVENLDVTLDNLLFNHPENAGYITGLKSTKGNFEFKQLQLPGMKPFDISMEVTGKNDQLDVAFISAMQKARSEHGTLDMDISKKEISYHLKYFVEDANLEHFIKRYYKRKLMKGNLNYKIDLQTHGSGWANIQQNISCNCEISGSSLRFYGVDIDNALKKYERSQNFNLTDLGAVLVAGPVGLVATKGTDFVALASIKLDSSKHTDIQTLYTRWKFEKEQLITEDVAFATTKNRVAFDGRVDFKKDSIPGITIAVVDKNGCSLMDQKLYGKIGAVKTGKLNITKTLLGSVINFVNAVVGKDCKPVYNGRVKQPVN